MNKNVIERVLGYAPRPRLPVVAHIGTGELAKNGRPVALGHFRFSPVPGAPDDVADAWVQAFGTAPRSFVARVKSMRLQREIWGRSKAGNSVLLHVCDGEHVLLEFNRTTRRLEPPTEEKRCDRSKCKPALHISLTVEGISGIVMLDVSGIYSINNIVAADAAVGGLVDRRVRFFLTKRPIRIQQSNGDVMQRIIDVIQVWPLDEPAAAATDENTIIVDSLTGEILADEDTVPPSILEDSAVEDAVAAGNENESSRTAASQNESSPAAGNENESSRTAASQNESSPTTANENESSPAAAVMDHLIDDLFIP